MTPFQKTIAYGAALTALWLVLGFVNPTVTYHLAPLLIAALVPLGITWWGDGRIREGAAIGAGLALLGTAILAAAGNLEGPSLLPFGDATIESLVFGGLGTVGGLVAAMVTATTNPS